MRHTLANLLRDYTRLLSKQRLTEKQTNFPRSMMNLLLHLDAMKKQDKLVFEVINDEEQIIVLKSDGVGHFSIQYDPSEGKFGWYMEHKVEGTYTEYENEFWEMDDFPQTTGSLAELVDLGCLTM